MTNEKVEQVNLDYYARLKSKFVGLIPEGPNIVLDLGCGAGTLGKVLRDMNKASEIIGVELYTPAAEEACKYYTKVYRDDVETLDLPYVSYFDIIICGDILEHLRDPWKMLSRINSMLKSGGVLICSIPNIRYFKIIAGLLFNGSWEYTDAGILDSTHLRFFTKRSFLEMLNNANFKVNWLYMSINGKKRIADRITCGLLSEFWATQILIAAKKV